MFWLLFKPWWEKELFFCCGETTATAVTAGRDSGGQWVQRESRLSPAGCVCVHVCAHTHMYKQYSHHFVLLHTGVHIYPHPTHISHLTPSLRPHPHLPHTPFLHSPHTSYTHAPTPITPPPHVPPLPMQPTPSALHTQACNPSPSVPVALSPLPSPHTSWEALCPAS